MIELKVKLTEDKKALGAIGEDSIIELHPKYLKLITDFTERQYKNPEDDKMGTKDVVVSEYTIFKKELIGQVSAAWWDEGQVWFVKVGGAFHDSLNINVTSEKEAIDLVNIIRDWLFD